MKRSQFFFSAYFRVQCLFITNIVHYDHLETIRHFFLSYFFPIPVWNGHQCISLPNSGVRMRYVWMKRTTIYCVHWFTTWKWKRIHWFWLLLATISVNMYAITQEENSEFSHIQIITYLKLDREGNHRNTNSYIVSKFNRTLRR